MMFGRKASKNIEEESLPRVSVTGAYGKLKEEADFIQFDASWREIKELDSILQGVYLNLTRSNREKSIKNCGLLMTGGSDRQGLFAYVYPSEDKAGRLYPFVIFNRIANSNYYYRPDALFIAGRKSIENVLSKPNLEFSTPNLNWISKLRNQPEYQDSLDAKIAKRESMSLTEKVKLEECLVSLIGSNEKDRMDFLTGLIRLTRALKQGRIHRAFQGIWLPLLNGESAYQTIAFWLQLLSALMPSSNWRPDVIWSINETRARLYIMTKPLTSSALETILCSEETMSFMGWPDMSGQEDEISESLKVQIRQWLSRPKTSLLDIAIEWYKVF